MAENDSDIQCYMLTPTEMETDIIWLNEAEREMYMICKTEMYTKRNSN